MDNFERDSENLLYFLDTLPQEESSASFEISAISGKLETFNLNSLPNCTIDLINMRSNSRSEVTAIDKSILFKPTTGNCILIYAGKKGKEEILLDKRQSHELDPNVQFSLKTNGAGCELILLLGGI